MILDKSLFLDRNEDFVTTRRTLPHWHPENKLQFITFRLADSLPKIVLEEFIIRKEGWLKAHPKPWSQKEEYEYHKTFSSCIDRWLDAGSGSCLLKERKAAEILSQVLENGNYKDYIIYSYVIMPNHVHLLVKITSECTLSQVLKRWKGTSARLINLATKRAGSLWCPEYFDKVIRDEYHYFNVIGYIEKNIKMAGVLWGGEVYKK